MASRNKNSLRYRGYLLHLTHYDPRWRKNKPDEKSFDNQVAGEILRALADQGFNMLLIGISDGVRYHSHGTIPPLLAPNIAEVIRTCKPNRIFHVGMDEDHDRSLKQYGAAIPTLRADLLRQIKTFGSLYAE